MKKSLVSVVIPTYNREKYIKRAIESVLNQTYKNIEVIIIDDCSIDKTAEIISKFSKKDPRIIILTNEANLGDVRSLNKGVKKAQGKYIARLDDDDFWCDEKKLEKQIDFLERHQDYVLVGGGMIRIDENGKEVVRYLLPESDGEIRELIISDNVFAHSVVVFRKSVWATAGGYDENLIYSNDWDLWLKLGKLGKFYNFQEYFFCYLQGRQNMSNFNIRRNLKINIRLRKKYHNDYPNFRKAFFLGYTYYLYSFLPFRKFLKQIFSKIRRIIFGPPVYKSFPVKK